MPNPQILKGTALGAFEAKSSGYEIVEAMADGRIRVPYMETLGMQFLGRVDRGHVELVLPVADWLRDEDGRIPSGAMLSIMDAAGGLAARSILPVGKSYLVASFQAAATNRSMERNIGSLHAIATVDDLDTIEGLILATVKLCDDRGRVLAKALLENAVLTVPPTERKDLPDNNGMQSTIATASYMDALGIMNTQEAGVSIRTDMRLHNSIGTMHGGAILSVLAEAAHVQVKGTLKFGQSARLSNISAIYLRPVSDDLELVSAKGYPIKPGSIISSAGALLGPDDRAQAKADCGFRIF